MTATYRVHIAAAVLSLLAVTGMTVRASSAAFSDATANAGNTFESGDVALSDDDGGNAMFAVTGVKPGESETKCINVSYSGTLDGTVKMYGAVTAGDGLEDYLNLTIERSTGATGGATASCTGFVEAGKTTVWSGTDGDLATFLTTKTDFATGVDSQAVTGGAPVEVASYRITAVLQDNNAAQGLSSTVTFT